MTPLAKKVFELFSKPELTAEPERKPAEEQTITSPSPWPCPHCGQPAEVEDVCPSFDGTRMLTLWHCSPCQVWAVTPSTLRELPTGWVKKTEQ